MSPARAQPAAAMTDHAGLLERGWAILSRWAVPVMMILAYALLVATSDASRTGEAWMAAGLVLVMTAWFTFRRLIAAAALSRALDVGDTESLMALADRNLPRRLRPAQRVRYLGARAFAQLLRGEHAAAQASIGQVRALANLPPLMAVVDTVTRIELHEDTTTAAFGAIDAPRTPWLGWLDRGALAWSEGRLDDAEPLLARVIGDIRAGSALRAIAHVYAARVASARAAAAAVTRHRAAAAALAAPEASWLRGEPRA